MPKRKATTTAKDIAKKNKVETTKSDTEKAETEKYYEARGILQETTTQYLIDCAPDSDTGEEYDPSWEPKENANQLLVADWNKFKEQESQKKSARKKSPRGEAVSRETSAT